MTDKVQKIREEVVRIINRRLNLINGDYFDLNNETNGFTNEIMDIVDSLQGEPVSEDLEEAANNYSLHFLLTGKPYISGSESDAFKAGAQWKERQMINGAVEVEVGSAGFLSPLYIEDYDKVKQYKYGDKLKMILSKEK